MIDELPKGWCEAEVGSVLKLINGFAFKPSHWGKVGLPIIRIQNLNNPDALFNHCDDAIPEKVRVRNGDLLFAWSGTPGTSFGAHLWKGGDAWLNQHIFRVEFDSQLFDKPFLRYAINQNLDLYISQAHGGAGLAHITKGMFEGSTLRLAPLPEQRRIVAKLETLLGKVDACQQRLAKIPVLLKRFRQSVLAAACSGRLTADWREESECSEDAGALLERMKVERRERSAAENGKRKYREPDPVADEDLPTVPETWRWTNFDHCAWEITVGHVGPMKDRYVEEGVTFLRSQNVKPLRFVTDGLVRIPADFHVQLSKSELLGGEILVVRSGANTGDCCVFRRNLGAANCSDLVITRPLSGLCSEFGALYVNSSAGQALLTQNQTGIAQPHFNIGAMRVKAFPLPPLAEQHEIVRRVEGLFALADQIEARFTKARAYVDKLTPSLLARAFAGKLVPQDPTDESAKELLNRINGRNRKETNGTRRHYS
jgi:type I restriction enzyme, S subunit